MIKWEYKEWPNPSATEMAELGADGWELVAVSGARCYFKRDAAIGVEMEAETRYGN